MAASIPPSKNRRILITGINGYIASNLALHFLTLGYSIHGTTRSEAEANLLLSSPVFASFISRIKTTIIPNIVLDGAFNQPVKGVHAIYHLATPINFYSGTKKDVIEPAVKGTIGLLKAAQKHCGSQLHTFIYMSSLAALLDSTRPAGHYTAESWNTAAESATLGLSDDEEAPFGILYPASKLLAERALLEFGGAVKPAFRLVSVVPAMVIGPPVLLPEVVEELNGTIKPIWEVLSGECRGLPRKVGSGMFVDVRDLVEVCVGFVESRLDGSGAKRVIVVGGRAEPRILARVLCGRYPESLGHLNGFLNGEAEATDLVPSFDTKEAERMLGRPWTSYEESVLDTAMLLEGYLT